MKRLFESVSFKKILAAFFSVIFLFSFLYTNSAFAMESENGDWSYEILGDETISITGYTGSDSSITIPAEIDGKQVTAVADGAFAANPDLVSIIVSDGVVMIGEEAFSDCPNLVSVSLPESVTSIGRRAFRYCISLESVVLPSELSEFPYQGFWDCRSLTSIVIPEGVSVIPNGCFYNCGSLKNATVPWSVTTIEKNAFHACLKLENIDLSENVTNIDESAFSDCEYLVIHAPEGSVADQYAKDNGFVPENVVLESPHPYTESGYWEYTYPGDAAALQVTFSPKTYVNGAFELDSITVIDQDENEFVFTKDELAEKTLVLPGNFFAIQLDAYFASVDFGFRVTAVEPMTEEEYQEYLDALDKNPWEARVVNGTLEITGYRGLKKDVTVPAKINGISVTSIGDFAFRNNQILTNVSIENGIQRIGKNAFESCENLETLTIPESVTEIGEYAFFACISLQELVFPDEVTVLKDAVANGCVSLKKVVLPDSLTIIEQHAFNKCTSLAKIDLPVTVTSIGNDAFSSTAISVLAIPDGVTILPDSMCQSCTDLAAVSLPDHLAEIGNGTFSGCTSLESIDFPDTLKKIGNTAFTSSGLTSVTLPEGLETIGGNAFSGTPLETFHIPATVSEMGENPVLRCDSLTELTVDENNPYFMSEDNIVYNKSGDILQFCSPGLEGELIVPEGVTGIAQSSCAFMNRITAATLPSTLTEIARGAFYGCASLETVIIDSNITSLPDSVFAMCNSLKKLYLPDSLTSIDRTLLYGCPNVAVFASAESYAFDWAKERGVVAIDPPEAVEGLVENDTMQELITPGISSDGTMLYAVGTSDEETPAADDTDMPKLRVLRAVSFETDHIKALEYSESIPKADKAGTYYVWYKAVVNDKDYGESCLKVTIAEKQKPPSPGGDKDKDPVSPPTNDSNHTVLWFLLMISGIAVIIAVSIIIRKKGQNR